MRTIALLPVGMVITCLLVFAWEGFVQLYKFSRRAKLRKSIDTSWRPTVTIYGCADDASMQDYHRAQEAFVEAEQRVLRDMRRGN